jgi:hypothetical protein
VIKREIFSARHGDPEAFVFKGQVWDTRAATGEVTGRTCGICHKPVRYAFVLKKTMGKGPFAPEIGKLEIGSCCFRYFQGWNRELHYQLECALEVELVRASAKERDERIYAGQASMKAQEAQWRYAKRQAALRLREMERLNILAPVADVSALREAIKTKPAGHKRPINAARWYEKQTAALVEKAAKLPSI